MITRGRKDRLIADLAMMNLDPEKIYILEVKEAPKRVTQNARGYYRALLHKYAVWTHKSDNYWHNDIISRFGEDETIGGETVYVLLPDDTNVMESATTHLKATSETRVGKDGKLYRWFIKKAGSHEYDSRQFSRLIDGLIEEIEGSGAPIQTMTPRELEALKGYEAIT